MNTATAAQNTGPDAPHEPASPRTGWFGLAVARLEHPTRGTVAVTLDVPEALAGTFSHRAGQHLVVRHRATGGELRRSYSLCPPPDDPAALRLVIRPHSPDGFGAHARTALAVGDALEVSPPTGRFQLPRTPGAHHVLIAGGCGITPLAPMAATALREDPGCRVSLIHAVRTAGDALLSDELALLKDEFLDRFTALYVLSREHIGSELLTGRLDGPKLLGVLGLLGAEPGPGTQFALCGPYGLVEAVRTALTAWGAPPDGIRSELFCASGAPPEPEPAAPEVRQGRITTVLGGRTGVVTMLPEDDVLLDAVLRHRPEAPYSCRDGVCGSCRAKVVSGAVTTGSQYALDAEDLDAGYTLTCRARPRADDVTLDFDA